MTPYFSRSRLFCSRSSGGRAVRVGKSSRRKTKSPVNAFTKSGWKATSVWKSWLGGDQSEPMNNARMRACRRVASRCASSKFTSQKSVSAPDFFTEVGEAGPGRGRGAGHGPFVVKSTFSTRPFSSVIRPCGYERISFVPDWDSPVGQPYASIASSFVAPGPTTGWEPAPIKASALHPNTNKKITQHPDPRDDQIRKFNGTNTIIASGDCATLATPRFGAQE